MYTFLLSNVVLKDCGRLWGQPWGHRGILKNTAYGSYGTWRETLGSCNKGRMWGEMHCVLAKRAVGERERLGFPPNNSDDAHHTALNPLPTLSHWLIVSLHHWAEWLAVASAFENGDVLGQSCPNKIIITHHTLPSHVLWWRLNQTAAL